VECLFRLAEASSETDQTDELKAITVSTLVMQGDDDQFLPYKDHSLLQAKLLQHSTLKIYPGFPHGMMTAHADVINADILAFIKECAVTAERTGHPSRLDRAAPAISYRR
jgi:pimeloyl-ACP methyl ester carboxylesterase